MANIHDGHRNRIRDRLLKSGLDGFQDHEVLEWLLFYTNPRKDVNPLAHELINAFGGFSGVLEADYDALMSVEGVGHATALFLSNLLSVEKRYQVDRRKRQSKRLRSLEEIADMLRGYLKGKKEEELYILLLNSQLSLIRCERVSEGSLRSVQVNMRRLAEICLASKATYVVLGHNHPSGILFPSDADVRATIALKNVLEPLEIQLIDHLILGEDGFSSMANSKEYSHVFTWHK
jgi:DNA repair protein RadC